MKNDNSKMSPDKGYKPSIEVTVTLIPNRFLIFACFLDLAKAFDTVWRDALSLKMFNVGLSSKFVLPIKNMYTKEKAKIKIDELSSEFVARNETRQGCNFSPSLFDNFIYGLVDIINGEDCDPNRITERFISILLYADEGEKTC